MGPEVGYGGRLMSYGGGGSPSDTEDEFPFRLSELTDGENRPRGGLKGCELEPGWYPYWAEPCWFD